MRWACVALAVLLAGPVAAADLGKIGPTHRIEEPHLLDFIQGRLKEKERSGELARHEEQARARAIAAIRQPQPVEGIVHTVKARTFYFDPTFVLTRNVFDEKGALLFPAGTRKNPLEVVSLSKRLVFFDARDARQVAHARRLIDALGGRVKPILVAGSYLDLMKSWRVPVYFDQHGTLTQQLGITQVPAIVSQEGLRLRIDEVTF